MSRLGDCFARAREKKRAALVIYLTAQDPTLQFGLGQWRGPVTVRVEWPAGASERFAVAKVGQRVTLTRASGTPVSRP